jgi:CheY-like chemotaxis protein
MKTTSIKNIVLYADDDPDDQYIVQEAFLQFDASIEVVCLPNGKKAMDYLDKLLAAQLLPCLVILDINMPVQDGKKTLQQIRESELLKNLPVVLFTTSSNPADETFAYQHRAGFITKPTAVNDLQSIASHFISHCRGELSGKVEEGESGR